MSQYHAFLGLAVVFAPIPVEKGIFQPLSAQARYAAGAREILECWLEKRPIREEYLIIDQGKLAGMGLTHTRRAILQVVPRRLRSLKKEDRISP